MAASQTGRWPGRLNKDYYGGALMIALGVGAVVKGLDYNVGSLTDMGPGYFPVAVGVVMAAMGIIIAIGAGRAQPEGDAAAAAERAKPEWRGWGCIVLANIAFVILGQYGGLVPATFAVVFISALGDQQNTVVSAGLLALAMVAISVIVFYWALKLQLPLFCWG